MCKSTTDSVQAFETVGDVMTQGKLWYCTKHDSVETALELLVENRITGLPVVDNCMKVVGVVSDFDLLALDTFGKQNDNDLFPSPDVTWKAFQEVRSLIGKSKGTKVGDVMTKSPICVTAESPLEDAAMLLLKKKIHRLPVVDGEGKLVGLISRGNVIKAALQSRKSSPNSA
jgi:CBS domain-containing protein